MNRKCCVDWLSPRRVGRTICDATKSVLSAVTAMTFGGVAILERWRQGFAASVLGDLGESNWSVTNPNLGTVSLWQADGEPLELHPAEFSPRSLEALIQRDGQCLLMVWRSFSESMPVNFTLTTPWDACWIESDFRSLSSRGIDFVEDWVLRRARTLSSEKAILALLIDHSGVTEGCSFRDWVVGRNGRMPEGTITLGVPTADQLAWSKSPTAKEIAGDLAIFHRGSGPIWHEAA